ncbi:hypothetical protein N7539_009322 [Penicillium diatomitis]|uniref:Uncharacterized protein n=1 Tax=Penicillium diatomitis TaxID=2819901 RepID=A0A9X0BJP6_9EURO|nr:uncharacterized protein N7539_009322 [Penicillium diatomitis]KAJ5469704.1 hypothetical protein N7539_009322 [Penicillium diatomitis]
MLPAAAQEKEISYQGAAARIAVVQEPLSWANLSGSPQTTRASHSTSNGNSKHEDLIQPQPPGRVDHVGPELDPNGASPDELAVIRRRSI